MKYLIYTDKRFRDFILKTCSGDFDISVYPKGVSDSNSRFEFMAHAVYECKEPDSADFISEDTTKKGYEVLYAVADEEGDVTYYKLAKRDSKGRITTG